MLSLDKATELVSRLDRTIGYPKDGSSVVNLAKRLQRASDALQVAGARIVERCAETSQYCPSDADMLTVARDIARLDALAAGTFDSTAGAGNHVRPTRPQECPKCHGTGWEIVYMLHTHEGNGRFNHVRKERISEAAALEMMPKLDTKRQMIYSGAKRCQCPVPEDRQMKAAGDVE